MAEYQNFLEPTWMQGQRAMIRLLVQPAASFAVLTSLYLVQPVAVLSMSTKPSQLK